MKIKSFAAPGKILGVVLFAVMIAASLGNTSSARQKVPAPAIDASPARAGTLQTAVLAGGCFWGIEAVFEHVKGVKDASSGYAGGSRISATYEAVSSGQTSHAEAVKVVYDPAVVSYGQLLQVFFSVAHDPTQLNRQGPDHGPQYRSAIFFTSAEQQRIAIAYVAQMSRARIFGNQPIVTQVNGLEKFFPAEQYHQDFARLNPTYPYIVYHDAPKVMRLKQSFPSLYRDGGTTGLASRSTPKD